MRYKLMTIKGCADDLFLQKMVKETFFKFFRNFFSFSIYKFCEEIINNLKFSTKRKLKIHNCILITPVIVSWIIFTFCVTSVLQADAIFLDNFQQGNEINYADDLLHRSEWGINISLTLKNTNKRFT